MNLREALAEARRLGLDVRHRNRTGEIVVTDGGRPMVVNSRRKDAPKALESYLRRKGKELGR